MKFLVDGQWLEVEPIATFGEWAVVPLVAEPFPAADDREWGVLHVPSSLAIRISDGELIATLRMPLKLASACMMFLQSHSAMLVNSQLCPPDIGRVFVDSLITPYLVELLTE